MISAQNGKLTKGQVIKMVCWLNGKLAKWSVDKMTYDQKISYQIVLLAKSKVDKMTN
jgi:hypothetical protein